MPKFDELTTHLMRWLEERPEQAMEWREDLTTGSFGKMWVAYSTEHPMSVSYHHWGDAAQDALENYNCPENWQLQRNRLLNQIDDLQQDVKKYERLLQTLEEV